MIRNSIRRAAAAFRLARALRIRTGERKALRLDRQSDARRSEAERSEGRLGAKRPRRLSGQRIAHDTGPHDEATGGDQWRLRLWRRSSRRDVDAGEMKIKKVVSFSQRSLKKYEAESG
jgi:hypothetical protein